MKMAKLRNKYFDVNNIDVDCTFKPEPNLE